MTEEENITCAGGGGEPPTEPPKSVMPQATNGTRDSSKDPMDFILKVLKDKKIPDADKTVLIEFSQNRFRNRRKMAFMCLWTLIISVGLIFLGAYYDGIRGIQCPDGKTCMTIMESIKNNESLLTWLMGFLTAIVGAYYGVSALRPSS